ncbi:MAG: PAS domain-containing protein, partial [Gemmatimonadaceae bacterium]|nr:PAS domain-containing protein [Acetobacteraceae bacterium]
MAGLDAAARLALLGSPIACVDVGPDGLVRVANAAALHLCPAAVPGALASDPDLDHLVTQRVELAGGGALWLLSTLPAAEDAEHARFEKTPYGIVRVDRQGRILFINARARALWREGTVFVGEIFAGLFPDQAAAQVQSRLRSMLASGTACTTRVAEGFEITAGGRTFRSEPQLTFVPYYAPGRRLTGAVVHIHERAVEALRIALREAAAGQGTGGAVMDWRDRMRAFLDRLQDAVPHDRAVVSVLSRDRCWARPILVHPPADPPMPPGWAPLPAIELARLQSGPFTVDFPTLIDREPALADNPLVASHIASGLVANAALPIPEGAPEAILSLSSRQRGHFVDDDGQDWSDDAWPQPPFRSLVSLGLDPLLTGMLRRAERQEEETFRELALRMGCTESLGNATQILLQALVAQFQWDHAALFAVEPRDDGGQFRLFAQFPEFQDDGSRHPLALPPGYTQLLYAPTLGTQVELAQARKSGMLGSAVRAGRALVASDTHERDGLGDRPHFFRSPSAGHGSAMTVPIEFDGRIRWVLDTVSRHRNAFHADDGDRAGPLVRDLARQLDARRSAWMNKMLIEQIEQGVLITDAIGTLLRANARARDILGLVHGADLPEGRRLSEHACDPATHEFLAGDAPTGRIRLGPLGGLGSDVRVRRCPGTNETRDQVWLLDGADEKDWTYDRTYIQATVQEVARQVRGPLLMASTLAGRIARQAADGALPEIEQMRAEIGRADITFERLAEAIGARRDPRRTDDRVDMAELVHEVEEAFPQRDRDRLVLLELPPGLIVRGDRDRLRLVLRMTLGQLLACNPERITIGLEAHPDGRRVAGTLATSDPAPSEPPGPHTLLEAAAQAAR